jgi:hypothetical protein
MAVTGFCISAKQELLQAIHCFNATQANVACTGASGANVLTGIATTGLSLGMSVAGTGLAANTYVVNIPTYNSVTIYPATTSTVSAATFAGDVFKLALIKVGPSLTYSNTQTNYGTGSGTPTTSNLGTDEASGTGYTAGGIALTNVQPSLPGNPTTTATTQFLSPSLTSATISVTAGLLYNTATRGGAANSTSNTNRAIAVYDYSGTVTVSNGTISFLMPTNDGSNALIRIA